MIWHTNHFAMSANVNTKTETTLNELLNLWHGDSLSMGWASPTLALNIARLVKSSSSLALAQEIYGKTRADEIFAPNANPEDHAVRVIIRKGFVLYRDLG